MVSGVTCRYPVLHYLNVGINTLIVGLSLSVVIQSSKRVQLARQINIITLYGYPRVIACLTSKHIVNKGAIGEAGMPKLDPYIIAAFYFAKSR